MPDATDYNDAIVAAIPISLSQDAHLARCPLAQRSGPEATLACAECGRAKWMHGTRHDTCGSFSWVCIDDITDAQIQALRLVATLPHDIKIACARALNEFGVHPQGASRDARHLCVKAINVAYRVVGARRELTENGKGL